MGQQTSRLEVQNLKSRDFEHNNGLSIPGSTLQWKGECFNLYDASAVCFGVLKIVRQAIWGVRMLRVNHFYPSWFFRILGFFIAPHLRMGKYPSSIFFDQPIAHPGYHRVPWRFHSDDFPFSIGWFLGEPNLIFKGVFLWLVASTHLKNISMGIFPKVRGETNKHLKPPPTCSNFPGQRILRLPTTSCNSGSNCNSSLACWSDWPFCCTAWSSHGKNDNIPRSDWWDWYIYLHVPWKLTKCF